MRSTRKWFYVSLGVLCATLLPMLSSADAVTTGDDAPFYSNGRGQAVQVGARPYYLIDQMKPGTLKTQLNRCSKGPFKKTDFSIGHRGAALQFPEHTKESYQAAARMGAGIVECDVTFTSDKALVCRHSQCDLHTTTNILTTPLAEKCSVPFTPAEFDPITGKLTKPANAQCCTSNLTLTEFKSLKGKMDAFNPKAKTAEEYQGGTPNWRTDLYTSSGTLMTHAESIELFKKLDVKMTPELKAPSVTMPYDGDYTQEDYAQQMVDEYKAAGVSPNKVWPQSFNLNDVLYWIEHEPSFGAQAVYLDERVDTPAGYATAVAGMSDVAAQGVNIIAPPMWALVTLDAGNNIVPSDYAIAAKAAGLDIITWTLERSGLLTGGGGYYYQSITPIVNHEGITLNMLDVLAQDVGVLGIFSDWPATVTYYANCMNLR